MPRASSPERLARRQFLSLAVISCGLGATDESGASAAGGAGVSKPAASVHNVQRFELKDDGHFPNSVYPALVYRGALDATLSGNALASAFEARFAANDWRGAWRNGLYRMHHYHSTAHEVLGVYAGWVKVRLGGPAGPEVTLHARDVAVLPAGVAHKNEAQADDFRVVGAYPRGTSPDMNYGEASERPKADANVKRLKVPAADPLFGESGPLRTLWA